MISLRQISDVEWSSAAWSCTPHLMSTTFTKRNRACLWVSHNASYQNYQTHSVNDSLYKILTEYFWKFQWKIALWKYGWRALFIQTQFSNMSLIVIIVALMLLNKVRQQQHFLECNWYTAKKALKCKYFHTNNCTLPSNQPWRDCYSDANSSLWS